MYMVGMDYYLQTLMLNYRYFNNQNLAFKYSEIPTLFTSYGVPARFTPSVTLTCNPVTSSGHVAVFTASVLTIFTVISEFTF